MLKNLTNEQTCTDYAAFYVMPLTTGELQFSIEDCSTPPSPKVCMLLPMEGAEEEGLLTVDADMSTS